MSNFKISMDQYLRILARSYVVLVVLQGLDFFVFKKSSVPQLAFHAAWTMSVLTLEIVIAITLLKFSKWGVVLFHLLAITQLIAYIGFEKYFGRQPVLVIFHIFTLLIYWKIVSHERRESLRKK